SIDIDNLPVGEYEVRAFFNNRFDDEAVASFVIKEYWEKGGDNIAEITLPNNKGFVYSPVGHGEDLPVVFFAYGGYYSDHEKYHKTLLNFIASRGYHAVFVEYENGDFTNATSAANKFAEAVAAYEDLNLQGVNKQKIGVVGHSSGGGLAFKVLKELKDTYQYGSDKSFVMAIDPWFAFEMNQQDLKDLPNNTNTLILQFGPGGNNMKSLLIDGESRNYSTDGKIAGTLFKYLNELYPENVDYKIFANVGDDRGHKYLNDDITEGNRNNKGNNYERMKDGLKPLGALMDFTFHDNLEAKAIALENNQRAEQHIFPKQNYAFKCTHNEFTDAVGKLLDTDVNYCPEDIPRSDN
ncbi:MAG: Bacillolysin (Neutral protease), partial [uncultured Thiotrichaceae bacterium]